MADAQHSAGEPALRSFLKSLTVSASGGICSVHLEFPLPVLETIVDAARNIVREKRKKKAISKREAKEKEKYYAKVREDFLAKGRELHELLDIQKKDGIKESVALREMSMVHYVNGKLRSVPEIMIFIRNYRQHMKNVIVSDVLKLSSRGMSKDKIADKLDVSLHTVKRIISSSSSTV